MNETLIKVENASKKFCRNLKRSLWYGMKDLGTELLGKSHDHDGHLRKDEFWAVKDVSFELKRGECLGLIGRNGAGKTTLLRMLNGLIKPDKGRIEMKGRVGALIALGSGFNPILTGRENIYINASVLGLSQKEIDSKFDEIVDFAELGEFIDTPVQSYSSGMQVRLGFSVATALQPDILLLDEVLAVGDTVFRGKCFKRIGEVLNDAAVVFVSHNEAQVNRICNLAIMLQEGAVCCKGNTAEVLSHYRDSQISQSPEARIVKDARVADIRLVQIPECISWGEIIKLKLQLQLNEFVSSGFILVHFAIENDFKANAEMRLYSSDVLRLNPGIHILEISIGPIHLTHGKYQMSFSMFDEFRKNTVVQVFDFTTVEIKGPVGSGLNHLIPMTFQLDSLPQSVVKP
jgi:lipopolysaccharide transport system ATP-binding protein